MSWKTEWFIGAVIVLLLIALGMQAAEFATDKVVLKAPDEFVKMSDMPAEIAVIAKDRANASVIIAETEAELKDLSDFDLAFLVAGKLEKQIGDVENIKINNGWYKMRVHQLYQFQRFVP